MFVNNVNEVNKPKKQIVDTKSQSRKEVQRFVNNVNNLLLVKINMVIMGSICLIQR